MTGPYFRNWRKYRKLTLAIVADKSGLSSAQISRIERGASDYSRKSLESLATVYSCETGDLLSTDPIHNSNATILDLFKSIDPNMRELALRVLGTLADASNESRARDWGR